MVLYLLFVLVGSSVMKAIYGSKEAPKGKMGLFTKLAMVRLPATLALASHDAGLLRCCTTAPKLPFART